MESLDQEKEKNNEELLNADTNSINRHSNPWDGFRVLVLEHGAAHCLCEEGKNVQPDENLREPCRFDTIYSLL